MICPKCKQGTIQIVEHLTPYCDFCNHRVAKEFLDGYNVGYSIGYEVGYKKYQVDDKDKDGSHSVHIMYKISFDGSAKPNPGRMTSAYVIRNIHSDFIFSETIESTGEGTSNLAEYIGLYNAVKKALEIGCRYVKIFGDSELIINQVNGKFKCNKPTLIYYRNKIQEILPQFHTYELTHVPRAQNKEADRLCRLG